MYITFQIVESGEIIEKLIPSYFKAMKFLNKLKHSKRLVLLAYGKA